MNKNTVLRTKLSGTLSRSCIGKRKNEMSYKK